MFMLKNMTIRVRVIAAFTLVLCAAVALGLFAIQRLSAVNAAAKDVGTNWLPAANYLGDLSQDFETYRSRQGQALLLTGEARETMLGKMQGSRDAIEKDFANYNATVDSGEERILADAIHTQLIAYYEASKPLEAATAANDVAGATTIYLTDMQAGTDELRKAIRADRAYQLKEGHNAADKGIKLGLNHPMGPFELADFIGLDTCLSVMQVLHEGLADSKYRPCPLLVKYVEAGWLGRKTKRGFYDYRGEKPVPTR